MAVQTDGNADQLLLRLATEDEQVEQLLDLTREPDHIEELEVEREPLLSPNSPDETEQQNDVHSDATPTRVANLFSGDDHSGHPNSATPNDGSNLISDVNTLNENSFSSITHADVLGVLGDAAEQNWSPPANTREAEGLLEDSPDKSQAAVNKPRLSKIAGEGAECTICFASLPSEPTCVLMEGAYGKHRACRHYFHVACAQLLVRTTPAPHLCPNCRSTFVRYERLPDVRLDSTAWFNLVDADDYGALDKYEVVDALSATLPVDPERLAASLEGDLWRQWDDDCTGRISKEKFEQPGRGLLHFVLYSLPSLRRDPGGGSTAGPVPDIVSCRDAWFRYWDDDSRQELEFRQLLRALVRSLRIEGAPEDTGVVRTVLHDVCRDFGLASEIENMNNEGRPHEQASSSFSSENTTYRPISMKLFCERPDGFCDVLLDELRKALGTARFSRMNVKAHLLQQSVMVLKEELRKLNCNSIDAIEKAEIVERILVAREAGKEVSHTIPKPLVASHISGPVAATYQAMSISELKQRLQALGVPHGHCLERCELVELLSAYSGGLDGRPVQMSSPTRSSPSASSSVQATAPQGQPRVAWSPQEPTYEQQQIHSTWRCLKCTCALQ